MRIRRDGTRRVPDLLGYREGVTGEDFAPLRVAFIEFDLCEVRDPQCRRREPACTRQRACLLERPARLVKTARQVERLSERHEPGVAPRASVGFRVQDEAGCLL